MRAADAQRIVRRIHALWRVRDDEDVDKEWLSALKPLDYSIADEAIDELRDTLMFAPSVADFRKAYYAALARCSESVDVDAGESPDDHMSLRERYGFNQSDWVYCWRCDQALVVDEDGVGYDGLRGFYHYSCPKKGSAPLIPQKERLWRDEYFRQHNIVIGPNVEPSPYLGSG